jgi:DNA-binding response OmpR family regulator
MKHHAKERPGSSFAVDQRTSLLSSEIERRRAHNRVLLLLSDDSSLRAILRSTFHDGGYIVHDQASVDGARRKLDTPRPPALVLADAQLGAALWEFCVEQAGAKSGLPIVVLAYDLQDSAKAVAAGAAACLQLPLPLVDIVACVDQLAGNGDTVDEARVLNSI